jgi:hypothetical protein
MSWIEHPRKPKVWRVPTALLASFSRKLGLAIEHLPRKNLLQNMTDIRPTDLNQC